jgi:hypothetical protein
VAVGLVAALLLAVRPAHADDPAAPAPALSQAEDEEFWTRGKIISASALGGTYLAFTVWAYFAWYYDKPRNLHFKTNGDGVFGVNTYAGGSDKLGHFWSNHLVSRATTEMLVAGGWKMLPASLIASGLSVAYFTFIEVKDGYYYEFSVGDWVADAGGAALSVLLLNRPELDRLLDFRVDYWPSPEYRANFEDGDVNFAEDYTGQIYLLATHLSGIPGLTDSRWTRWARYVDVVGGFQSENYKPDPMDADAIPSQHLFVGASLNLQSVLEDLYGEREERGVAHLSHRIGHFAFEFISPPYTTLRMAETSRSRPEP